MIRRTLLAASAGASLGLVVGFAYGTVWARPVRITRSTL